MPSTPLDEVRDYGFADKALALRKRAGLTQRWEAGRGLPGAANLRALIALYLERGAFTPGYEEEAATTFWEAVRRESLRLRPGIGAPNQP